MRTGSVRDCGKALNYTRPGIGNIGTGGKRAGDHARSARAQKSATDTGAAMNAGWSRNRHAATRVGNGSRGRGAARVCFDSFSPLALSATGTCK